MAVEGWLWLRWQLWSGPLSVVRSVWHVGRRVREEEAVGLLSQARDVAKIALGYCIPPFEVYRYRLYRSEYRHRAPELVFDHTAQALRNLLNGPAHSARASFELISDKERQTAMLTARGVPVAPIHALAIRGSGPDLNRYLDDGTPVFCKPRHGAAGLGAFSARMDAGVLRVEPLMGPPLEGDAAMAWWQEWVRRDDMLIQPKLSVHRDLASAASERDIVTARYITLRGVPGDCREAQIEPYCATLELPAGIDEGTGGPFYVILVVEPSTGQISPYPCAHLPAAAVERQRAALEKLLTRQVPGWEVVRECSALAHRQFPGLHSIAWDWAITPEGPLLLEGNAGWGTATPQQLRGGLLRPGGWLQPSGQATKGAG